MDISTTLVLIGLAILLWATTFARWRFIVHHSEVAVLPKGSKPIRVLHISDIHLAPWQNRKMQFISNLIDQKPDLVINTGDNLGHKDVVALTVETLEPLLGIPGAFVNGSNDYYAPVLRNPLGYLLRPSKRNNQKPIATQRLTDAFEDAGWKNLNNKSASLKVGELTIGLLGVDDPHDQLDDLASLPNQKSKLPKVELLLGVAHAPYRRVIEAMAEQGVALMFAGHTHGGQVRIPGIGSLTTNSDLPNKHSKGLSAWAWSEHLMLLNVSAGMGNSIFAPIRFWNRPEARIITLVERRD